MENQTKINLAERLRHLRLRSKYTVSIVAEALQIKISRYQHYESGRAEPPLSMLIAIASIYNLSLDELIGNARPKQKAIEDRYLQASPENKRIVNFILGIEC